MLQEQPTILLTGANGQLGFELARVLRPLGTVIATERSTLVERVGAGDALRHTPLGTARFVPLLGEHGFDA